MITKNTAPNAQERKFLNSVIDFHNQVGVGYLYGQECQFSPLQYHHVVGRSYKQNKIKIGNFFILPVPQELHDVGSNDPDNVTHFRHNFTRRFGNQRDLWQMMICRMEEYGLEIPSLEIIYAISVTKY